MKNYCNGELLDSYSYSYDNNGNITSVTTTAGTIFYQYDGLNQLTQETLLDGTVIDYQYDLAGNKTTKTVTQGGTPITTNYTYDAANQLTAVDGQAYTYDDNGNLISDGEKTYVYNEVNRLVEVRDSSGNTISAFTYDYDGRRTTMTTSNGTINYHYNKDKVIYETDVNGNILTEYTWDADGRPLTMIKDGVTFYYHLNAHDDVTNLTDENGNVVAQYEYDAWGNILSQSGSMAAINPYRYASYSYDEQSGLYYLSARYYNPDLGRFITRDLLAGLDERPITLNLYAYANNNPVLYKDPDGNFAGFVGAAMGAVFSYIIYDLEVMAGIRDYNSYQKAAIVAAGAVIGAINGAVNGVKYAKIIRLKGYVDDLKITRRTATGVRTYFFIKKKAIMSTIKNATKKEGESWMSFAKKQAEKIGLEF